MSEIKDLVPPLDLCKMIPAGEFADSVAIWVFFPKSDKKFHLYFREDFDWSKSENYPAPTLEEIMEELPHSMCYRHANPGRFTMRTGNRFETVIRENNPSSAALYLWLKTKGIEDGK